MPPIKDTQTNGGTGLNVPSRTKVPVAGMDFRGLPACMSKAF